MKRIAITAIACTLFACGGSDNSTAPPSDTFTGTWTGIAPENADTLHFTFIAGQAGSAISGTGTVEDGGNTALMTFTGTLSSPSLIMTLGVNAHSLAYSGTFVRSDSVVGHVAEGSTSLELDLVKQ
jgi:hypothetical protein